MNDINLLPDDQRQRDLSEQKKKVFEKSKVSIELTDPQKKSSASAKSSLKSAGFFSDLKKDFKNIFKKPAGQIQNTPNFQNKVPAPAAISSKMPAPLQIKKDLPPKKNLYYANSSQPRQMNKNGNGFFSQSKADFLQKNNNFQKAAPIAFQKKEEPIHNVPRGTDQSKKDRPGKIKMDIKLETAATPITSKLESKPLAKIQRLINKTDINLIPDRLKTQASSQKKLKTLIAVAIVWIIALIIICLVFNSLVVARRNEMQTMESEIQNLQAKINQSRQADDEVSDFIDLLKELKGVINGHIFASNIFKFLERFTLKDVYYTELQFEAQTRSVSLMAHAQDYKTMAEQMLILKELADIFEKVEIEQADLEEEEIEGNDTVKEKYVTFDLLLKFKPEFLNSQN